MAQGHADAIAPLIREVMDEAESASHDLGRIGVTIGPGNLHRRAGPGLRWRAGSAWRSTIPVVGIGHSDGDRRQCGTRRTPVAVAADARRGESISRCSGPRSACRSRRCLPVAEAAAALPEGPSQHSRHRRRGADRRSTSGTSDRSQARRSADARNFAPLARSWRLQAVPPEPLYLRPPDAKPQASRHAGIGCVRIDRRRSATGGPVSLLSMPNVSTIHGTAAEIARLMAMPGALALSRLRGGDEPWRSSLARRAADEAEILTSVRDPLRAAGGAARALVADLAEQLRETTEAQLFIEVAARQ